MRPCHRPEWPDSALVQLLFNVIGKLTNGGQLCHIVLVKIHAYPQTADFPAGGPEIAAYLRGETLHGTQRGWTLLTAGGLSLGWVRGADGILKNQYPKGLRRLR